MTNEPLGPYFTLAELLRSDTAVRRGIDNVPKAAEMDNLRNILAPGLTRVREVLGAPVFVTSGYRSPTLNQAIGGSANSQHSQGLAADFVAPAFGSPRAVVKYLLEHEERVRWDQLIFEGTWVHVSFAAREPRGEVLTAHFTAGQVTYSRGLA